MPDTIIQSGTFTGVTGQAVTLQLRESIDWIKVYNYTNYSNAAHGGLSFYFDTHMASNTGLSDSYAGGAYTPAVLGAGGVNGFTYVDSSQLAPTAAVVGTSVTSNAINVAPRVTNALPGVFVGSIVRLSNLDHQFNIQGMDFTVTNVATPGTNFDIGNITLQNSTASTVNTARLIPFDPYYYPRSRYITYCRAGTVVASGNYVGQTVIYMSVTHGYTAGQEVTLHFPGGASVWGSWSALDGKTVKITAINSTRVSGDPANASPNNIVVDISSIGFTAWDVTFGAGHNQNYPADNLYPITPATVAPIGEDTAIALNNGTDILADATYNTAYIGVILGTDNASPSFSPAGATGDQMYWIAGKSFATQP